MAFAGLLWRGSWVPSDMDQRRQFPLQLVMVSQIQFYQPT
jgi:hypothetical protein